MGGGTRWCGDGSTLIVVRSGLLVGRRWTRLVERQRRWLWGIKAGKVTPRGSVRGKTASPVGEGEDAPEENA